MKTILSILILTLSAQCWANAEWQFKRAEKNEADAEIAKKIAVLIAPKGCSIEPIRPLIEDENDSANVGVSTYYLTTSNCVCRAKLIADYYTSPYGPQSEATCYRPDSTSEAF